MARGSFHDVTAEFERLAASWPGLGHRGAPGGLDACVDLVRELAGSDVLRDRIAGELATLAAEPTHTLFRTAGRNHWVLWASPDRRGASLSLVRVPVTPRDDADYLTDAAGHQILAPCGPGSMQAERYEQRGAADPEAMGADEALTPRGPVTLRLGDALVLEPRRDVVDLLPPAEPAYLLVFDGPRVLTQRWVYDKSTLRAVSSVAASPHDARLEGGMRLLRVLGHTPAAPVVAALAAHEAHFVRWTAIRYTMALDPDEGRRLLESAVTDPHPHVRRAAERALERLEGARPDPEAKAKPSDD
jgi:hypothetical protein